MLCQIEEKLRGKDRVKICNNTYLIILEKHISGCAKLIGLLYHKIYVVEFDVSGLTLNTGGWSTVTTKDRINIGLAMAKIPLRIYQEQNVWKVWNNIKREVVSMFSDNMFIDWEGNIPYDTKADNSKALNREWSKMRYRIKKYVDKFIKECLDGNIPEPSTGDCLYCQTDQSDYTCLISHISESYFVPSLLVNSIAASNGNIGFLIGILLYDSNGEWKPASYSTDMLKEHLTKYMYKRIRPAIFDWNHTTQELFEIS